MNSIHMSRIATQGGSIAGAHVAARCLGRAAPRLPDRPWRLNEGCAATTAGVHAVVVDERDVALDGDRRLGKISHTLATRGVSILLTATALALAALSVGCDSLPATKMTDPMISQGSCVPPPDSRQMVQVSSRSGTEC